MSFSLFVKRESRVDISNMLRLLAFGSVVCLGTLVMMARALGIGIKIW